jgi:hypothetical protein
METNEYLASAIFALFTYLGLVIWLFWCARSMDATQKPASKSGKAFLPSLE